VGWVLLSACSRFLNRLSPEVTAVFLGSVASSKLLRSLLLEVGAALLWIEFELLMNELFLGRFVIIWLLFRRWR